MAANATVDITRGVEYPKLSFVLPAGMDVESVSGEALSHWTESKTEERRVITLHLKGKTEGHLSSSRLTAWRGRASRRRLVGWLPQLVFREAGKQWGTLVVAPEQGMRLQAAARDGVTQCWTRKKSASAKRA